MIGTENQYLIYDDGTFNCPLCALVHWPKDYAYRLNKYGNEFEMRCLNYPCRTRLMVIVNDNIVKVTTKAWDEAFKRNRKPKRDYNNRNNKTETLMKKINVQSHLKRYADVDTNDKLALIKGLQDAVENDRVNKIQEMKTHLQKLEAGEFPAAEQPAPKKQTEPIQQDIVEEPSTEPEVTQEEAFDNL